MRGIALLTVAVAAVVLVVFLFLGKSGAPVNPQEPFKVDAAYARAVGASAMAGAAFMEITNQSGQSDRLIGASSTASAMAELHTHIEDNDGIMMMRQIEGGLEIAAGDTALLKRGGDHVMLMGLNGALDTGATIEITLTFEKAGDVVVSVPVDNDR